MNFFTGKIGMMRNELNNKIKIIRNKTSILISSFQGYSRKKKIIFSMVVILVIFFLWRIIDLIFFASEGKVNYSGKPPVAVEVDSVRFGFIAEKRDLTGTIYPKYQYIIASKVAGRIIAIYKRIGDWVKAGELVARLDHAEYEQGVMEANASLKIAEAALMESRTQLELARQEKDRVVLLQEKGIASSAELDAAISNYSAQESRYQLARAQVEQRQASLRSAQIRLGYTRLTASQPGFIGERFVDEGALLAPNAGVVSIIGIDSVIIRTTIIERDYADIKIGHTAEITVDSYPDHPFSGIVSRLAPMLQESSRAAQMEVEAANDSLLLKPGMFARVEVSIKEKDSVQIIPSKALINKEGESGIFVVNFSEKKAHYLRVITGVITPENIEIMTPAIDGLVVTLGQHLLEEGSPVLLSVEMEDKKNNTATSLNGDKK
jgi:RND family efflux transporter MFP subunit